MRRAAAVDLSAGLRDELPVHGVCLSGDLDHGLLVLDEGDLGREGRGAREHLVLERHQAALDVPQLRRVIPPHAGQIHPPAAEAADRLLRRVAEHHAARLRERHERAFLHVDLGPVVEVRARVVLVQPQDAVAHHGLAGAHVRRGAAESAVEVGDRGAEDVDGAVRLLQQVLQAVVSGVRGAVAVRGELPGVAVEEHDELLALRRGAAGAGELGDEVRHLLLLEAVEFDAAALRDGIKQMSLVLARKARRDGRHLGGGVAGPGAEGGEGLRVVAVHLVPRVEVEPLARVLSRGVDAGEVARVPLHHVPGEPRDVRDGGGAVGSARDGGHVGAEATPPHATPLDVHMLLGVLHAVLGVLVEPPLGRVHAHARDEQRVRVRPDDRVHQRVERREVVAVLPPDLGDAVRNEVHAHVGGLAHRGEEGVGHLGSGRQRNLRVDAGRAHVVDAGQDPGTAVAARLEAQRVDGALAEAQELRVEVVVGVGAGQTPGMQLHGADAARDGVDVVALRRPDLPDLRERRVAVERPLQAGRERTAVLREGKVP